VGSSGVGVEGGHMELEGGHHVVMRKRGRGHKGNPTTRGGVPQFGGPLTRGKRNAGGFGGWMEKRGGTKGGGVQSFVLWPRNANI